ncbi:hypothetical protein [Vibrio cholerae]|uniref:hypothetical protein n=1 Tax=Vibrio cholerae TaxID=666 RepID=UPI00069ECD81|nr:hypothetical protein [Vibrio cholerae]EGR0595366.1 hypothetical protein [Vibrio cholerae]EJP6367375.1 hypothetical protein [Vibrio cholerae]ELI9715084.1 hypothetical protein [Vibrio cholerae]KNH52486.1 hypothetical protein A59_0495 [Vibrio cholerae 623-39]GHX69862.1 ATPase AAA [Vibrio cholerae]
MEKSVNTAPPSAIRWLTPLALLLSILGCKNDDNPTVNSSPQSSLSVTVIDGYLVDALVWLDINNNYQLDEVEPRARTNAKGVAQLDLNSVINPEQYKILVHAVSGQTKDIGTGNDIPTIIQQDFMMSAPSGISVVTPLTTLVEQRMQENNNLDLAAAQQEIANLLGLSSPDEVLGDFIVSGNNRVYWYAVNIVKGLPSQLTQSSPSDLIQTTQKISELIQELAPNFDSKPEVIVTLPKPGVIKPITPPSQEWSIRQYFIGNDKFAVFGDDDGKFWYDVHLINDKTVTFERAVLLEGLDKYSEDPSMSDNKLTLTEQGWIETTDKAPFQVEFNQNGSVSWFNGYGKMSGKCFSVADKDRTELFDGTAEVFGDDTSWPQGAEVCEAQYTPVKPAYDIRISNNNEKIGQFNTLDMLIDSNFQYDNKTYRLDQNNKVFHVNNGNETESGLTWSKSTLGGVELILFSDREGESLRGFAIYQGYAWAVHQEDEVGVGQPMLLINDVMINDIAKGRSEITSTL